MTSVFIRAVIHIELFQCDFASLLFLYKKKHIEVKKKRLVYSKSINIGNSFGLKCDSVATPRRPNTQYLLTACFDNLHWKSVLFHAIHTFGNVILLYCNKSSLTRHVILIIPYLFISKSDLSVYPNKNIVVIFYNIL